MTLKAHYCCQMNHYTFLDLQWFRIIEGERGPFFAKNIILLSL
jgi:hypothetical protein